jgi:AcrR family transcriptional regulator
MSKSDASRRVLEAAPSASPSRRHEAAKPKRRTQAERSAQMQRRILEAASEVIRKRGYARFRTAEVARVARVSRGAQLHHFPTKKALVVATLRHVFEQALQVSRRRASSVPSSRDTFESIIDDAREFFFGEHFFIAIDIVLSTSNDRRMRNQITSISRNARLPVEKAWCDALIAAGVPSDVAAELLALTLSIVRGLSIRTLWDNDPQWFDKLFLLWREMVHGFLASRQAMPGRRGLVRKNSSRSER